MNKLAQEISLNGTWDLLDEAIDFDLAKADSIANRNTGWIPTPVPGDVHQGLMDAGKIPDPLVGLNSFECDWIGDRSWWFRREFDATAAWLAADVAELVLDGLDSNAEVFLNSEHIGSHRNSFVPFVKDIKTLLKEGTNTLLVRLSTGVENVTPEMVAALGSDPSTLEPRFGPPRGDVRRAHVRKPQYSFGWDWGPCMTTVAIGRGVSVRLLTSACIRDVTVKPVSCCDSVVLKTTVTVDRLHHYSTSEGAVSVSVSGPTGQKFTASTRTQMLLPGLNFIDLDIVIEDPQLWWPAGMGDQPLYTIEASLDTPAGNDAYEPFEYGIRFVEYDTTDTCVFIINGSKVFARGANWVPQDSIYARVTDERVETLVKQAADANFNMLRIWGGGLYEREAFYRTCNRLGIMVFQDFMFACSPYPDELEWFRNEVAAEAEYQVKRLQNHASIVLWCGNNECTWGIADWWKGKAIGGAHLYNYLLPKAVRAHGCGVPYWTGSPCGGENPSGEEAGSVHFYMDAMINDDIEIRTRPEQYDLCTSYFVAEYSYPGTPCVETIRQFMGTDDVDRTSDAWKHHLNTFDKGTVVRGIQKRYKDDTDAMSIEDFAIYGGLVHGMMLGYAMDSMRASMQCNGSLFWMLADSWGEIGWTIVDYYLRRKPAYYYVRRSYAPIRLVARPVGDGEKVQITAINDKLSPLSIDMEFGYVSLDGANADLQTMHVELEPMSKAVVCTFAKGDADANAGLWIARASGRDDIVPAVLRAEPRDLQMSDPQLEMSIVSSDCGECTVRVRAAVFAHAVHFDLPEGALPEDNYFDLLPGESRQVVIKSSCQLDPKAVSVTSVRL